MGSLLFAMWLLGSLHQLSFPLTLYRPDELRRHLHQSVARQKKCLGSRFQTAKKVVVHLGLSYFSQ